MSLALSRCIIRKIASETTAEKSKFSAVHEKIELGENQMKFDKILRKYSENL